jgi:hypothetical protein
VTYAYDRCIPATETFRPASDDRDRRKEAMEMRSTEAREARAGELRDHLRERARFEEEHGELLDLGEAAALLKVSRDTARRLLRNQPGVHLLRAPGRSRPMIRVNREVIERVLRQSANR